VVESTFSMLKARAPRLYTTEAPPKEAVLQQESLVARQRRNDTVQSIVAAVIVVAMLAAILYLITILPSFRKPETIVAYSPPRQTEDKPTDRPDFAKGLKPTPTSASSSMARTIAAAVEAPVALPVPEETNPTMPFGMDDDFAAGFGTGEGDGDGGGGSSFFGTPRQGRRVVYVVDFSESMRSDAEGGGTRLDALKKELVRSIDALKEGMSFNVIFFSHNAWTINEAGPNDGWNGLNETPAVPWNPATDRIKAVYREKIHSMGTGHGTVWYSPLKMALSMTPVPNTIYMLSDGEPTDLDDVLSRIDEMNPHEIPVDTIVLETPGEPAQAMLELAEETGGGFTVVYKGKAHSGRSATKFTAGDWER